MTISSFGRTRSPAWLPALALFALSTLALPRLAAAQSSNAASSNAASPAPTPGLGDSVWLKDGTRLRGTVLRVEKGNYVLLLGVEGVRTIPWRTVSRVENASDPAHSETEAGASPSAPCCTEDVLNEAEPEPGADRWAAVSLGWDLRLEGVSLFKHYTVGGQGTWYGGEGWGGGGSLSLHFRGPASLGGGTAVRWAEFELGVTDSIHSVTWKEGAPNETKFTQNQLSLILGAHIASGRWGSAAGSPWSGVVFGLAWLPTYVRFFGSGDFDATGQFHVAGLRATVDWGRVSPTNKGLVPGMRASLTWLPYIGNLPTAVSLGLGCVFY